MTAVLDRGRSHQSHSMLRVATFPNRIVAGMAAGLLESHGIEHLVTGDDVGIFGPGHIGHSALGIDLLVRREDLEEARQLLQEAGLEGLDDS